MAARDAPGARNAGRGVTVHSDVVAVEQDRPSDPVANGAVDRSPDGRCEWYEGELRAFPQHA